MLRAAAFDAVLDAILDPGAIPALYGAPELLAQGIVSSLHADNRAALAALDPAGRMHPIAPLLLDPQTAGGLLAGLAADRAERCLDALRRQGCRAALIGRIEPGAGAAPRVRLEAGAATVVRAPVAVL
jgi:selenide,water dikinase